MISGFRFLVVPTVLTALLVWLPASARAVPAVNPAPPPPAWDVMSDTWAAADAIERTLPTAADVGAPRPGRFVGMFYFLWLGSEGTDLYDISKILTQDPGAMKKSDSPLWGPVGAFHFWGEPLFGYYTSTDEWVYRKHAQMLADAGVDTLIFDCSNAFTYPEAYRTLLRVFSGERAIGNRTPQVAFLCPFGAKAGSVVRRLYDDLYGPGRYRELWFQWYGKPLILADPEFVEPALLNFFTFRAPEATYFAKPDRPNRWGWLDVYPQRAFRNAGNEAEEMTVSPAQNAQGGRRLCAMSETNVTGRSWSAKRGARDPRPNSVLYGVNYEEQWENALNTKPEFVLVTGWNEWAAQRMYEFNGVRNPVMFVDAFSPEYSRDLEPMKGGYGDLYYYQTIANIRKFKGVRSVPVAGEPESIRIDGSFDDWAAVRPEYRDTIGDVAHRDHPGFRGGGPYLNRSGRNDIVLARVTYDRRNLYFYVRTRDPLSPPGTPGWMALFLDTDQHRPTGWQGYDVAVGRAVNEKTGMALIELNEGGQWSWKAKGEAVRQLGPNEMELMIPRASVGLADRSKPLKFDFKWADNTALKGDVMEFTTQGDAAPNDRYNYRFTVE